MKIQFRYITSALLQLILIVSNTQDLRAQQVAGYRINGMIIDSTSKKPVEFATISILDSTQNTVALTYSDESGIFKSSDIKNGRYSLNLSFIGYQPKSIPFLISAQRPVFDFGRIYLIPDVRQLSAVTITGSKQLIDQQPGMLIYNAENDISNQGGTAADVLRKAPILNVDAAGNVTMRGNSNLRILINGKYSGQMARSPGDALNMMPAGSIKAVEVITSPSARYDAEGAAGVINIITKKGQQRFSGTIEAVGGNLEQAINPRIGINRDKWNINSTLHLHKFRNRDITDLSRVIKENGAETARIEQHIVRDNVKPHSSGDIQVEFAPDSSHTFNLSLNGWLGSWPQNSEQHNRKSLPDGTLTEDFRQTVKTKAPNAGFDLNLGYTRKFQKPGHELYFMAQHNRSRDRYDYNAVLRDSEELPIYRELNNNLTKSREWTLQSDHIYPFFGKHALESGVKAILRNVRSDYDTEASRDGLPEVILPIPSRSGSFDYRQDVLAAYSQLKFKWNNGWALHAGARMEGTFLEGKQQNTSTDFRNNFWNFVPGATLFKKLNPDNNITLSYTRRISRPSIWDLNPNIDKQDPKNIVIGNPALRPEKVDQTEFTYGLQTNAGLFMNMSIFARNTSNSIESLVTIDTTGIATTTKQNLASNGQFGINFSTSFNLLSNLKINSNANIRHSQYKSGALNIQNQGMVWGLNLNSSWKLRNNYSVQFYGDYDARSVTLQGYKTGRFYYSFSAKKEIPSRKLTVSLTTVSPFGSYISQNEIVNASGFSSEFRSQYLRRSVRFSVNWEFGSMFSSGNSRKISNDDLKNSKQGGQ